MAEGPWGVLGLKEGAGPEEVHRAWLAKAMELHPDRGGDARAFIAARTAYEAIVSGAGRAWLGPESVEEPPPDDHATSRVERELLEAMERETSSYRRSRREALWRRVLGAITLVLALFVAHWALSGMERLAKAPGLTAWAFILAWLGGALMLSRVALRS